MRFRRILPIIAGMVATTLALAPGTAGAQQEPLLVDTSLDYVCAEAGPVTVRVAASFPTTGTVGEPVEPSEVEVEVTLPAAALAGLPNAASVTSTAKLEVLPETWTAVLSEPVPLADPVVLGGTVTAPPLTPEQAGDLAFTAGNLAVTVTGYTADGAPTEPPTVDLTCVLDPAESGALATVPVAPPVGTGSEVRPPSGKPAERAPGSVEIAVGPAPEWCFRLRPLYPEIPATHSQSFCTLLTGYSNVKKLNASVFQPPAQINIAATNFITNRTCAEGPAFYCQKAFTLPELNGKPQLPPAPGSFFTLGFVPTTGTMQLTQIGLAEVYLYTTIVRPYKGVATIKVKLSAQILNHPKPEVNGVPLDVGPDCRTAEPIDAVFTAVYPDYSITEGGVMTGTVTIPPFSGCGVSEDLDFLFTNVVSGPGNYVKLTQGPVCYFTGNLRGCPPAVQIPDPPER
jgi:hypothetical protein